MNGASILMNMTAPTPVASATAGPQSGGLPSAGAEALPAPAAFDQALAAAQADVAPEGADAGARFLSLESVSDLLLKTAGAESPNGTGVTDAGEPDTADGADADLAEDASASGAAAILAQMLLGSTAPAAREGPSAGDVSAQAIAMSGGRAAAVAKSTGGGTALSLEDSTDGAEVSVVEGSRQSNVPSGDQAARDPGLMAAATALPERVEPATGSAASPALSGNAAQLAVQSAANALRDALPTTANAPLHSTLREPVGSARWAEELGNRLVLMSARGQQQGSLTLTPEHLGPMEVQISVSKDTANVWFGAQHADTRAALAEAMPRLREMLASTGLSLGQSGVSEQAPRERFPASVPLAGSEPAASDITAAEAAPVWRRWQPGLVDTYA